MKRKNEVYIELVILRTDRIEKIFGMTISELFATGRLKTE